MFQAEAVRVSMSFILCISATLHGRANSICALKGSSVDLRCSTQHRTSNTKWYTMLINGSMHVLNEPSEEDGGVPYNAGNFSLTIEDVSESDEGMYCCGEEADQQSCWDNRILLQVTDLQVKVFPATEAQTVTLMCSSSCPLSENPAAYIWFKNRGFLYQDWSPWYQHLVSGDKAVTYSCAIQGHEHLRAPPVSVDSVTSTCFNVTYAGGRMCSYKRTPADGPCSVTYPRGLQVEVIQTVTNLATMTCKTSCPEADPDTSFRWYNPGLVHHCEAQDITLFGNERFRAYESVFSCAVKGHEDLRSDEQCKDGMPCWAAVYAKRKTCALEGSSVNFSQKYSEGEPILLAPVKWIAIERHIDWGLETLNMSYVRVDLDGNKIIRINNLTKNDSGVYMFRRKGLDFSGWTLVVTGLRVVFSPSAVVTEGQRVTLTCSTSCPLTHYTNYTWYLNSLPLNHTENQDKELVLDPVRSQHAGNYSCALQSPLNTSSQEKSLTVLPMDKSALIGNAVKLTLLTLMITSVFLLCLMMRRKKQLTSAGESSDTGQMELPYENIALKTLNPEAQTEPAEEQEDIL